MRFRPRGRRCGSRLPFPRPVSDVRPAQEEQDSRGTRLLPLSAKSDSALRHLAGRYFVWLDARNGAPVTEDTAAAPLLSDLAWTAGAGRSHFAHRAGIVFHDTASLREGLRALADGNEGSGPREATKVAFAYAGRYGEWAGMGALLYRSEPAVPGGAGPLRCGAPPTSEARRCSTRCSDGPARRELPKIRRGYILPSMRWSARSPPCGRAWESGRAWSWGTASGIWRRPTRPECSAWRTGSVLRRRGESWSGHCRKWERWRRL